MTDDYPWRDEETLRELHVEKELSAGEIGDRLGCSKQTILTWCDKHGIEYDQNRGKPWFDEQRLRELYHDDGLSTIEVADELGCSPTVIRRTMEKFGIDRRMAPQERGRGAPWRDEDTLREAYQENGRTVKAIADDFGCSGKNIRWWLDRHGIEKRDAVEERLRGRLRNPASFEAKRDGYERWKTSYDGETWYVYVHRLLAVAEFGFEAVGGKDIHHINGVPWDNRHENIELLTKGDHARLHNLADS